MMTETEKLLLEAQRATERDDWSKVIGATDELLKRDPKDVDAMFMAGVAFLKTDNEGLALQMFNLARQATADRGKLGAIWNNIGCALKDYHPHDAYAAFTEALKFGRAGSTYENMCSLASQIGRHEEALEWADKCEDFTSIDPAYNRSFALFSLGRWEEAWFEYDKCAMQREGVDRNYGLPRATALGPNTIIHGEQGIGDEILFMSMCPPDFAGHIECNPRNAALFARSFPDARVHGTLNRNYLEWLPESGAKDHIEMGGLGGLRRQGPFARGHYLVSDRDKVAMFSAWLRAKSHAPLFRVGVAWTGGAWHTGRARRSLPLYEVRRLNVVKGVQYVCLEYDDRAEECAELGWLNPTWATKKGADYDDLAALVTSLDLVIAATTSVVDLCGALGVPCWALVDENPQWRYSPAAGESGMWFYDSVRTFRQHVDDKGSWTRPMTKVIMALRDEVKRELAA